MVTYVGWEQDALLATSRMTLPTAIKWWQANWDSLRARLALKELPLLNQAIAQQAGISGDLLLPELSTKLDRALTNDGDLTELKKIWNANGLLAENIVRYWLWTKIKARGLPEGTNQTEPSLMSSVRWTRTLYAFAWESGDDAYWRILTKHPTAVTFAVKTGVSVPDTKTPAPKWTIQFRDLEPVPMPEPASMNLLELRWPTALSALVEARERVLETITSADYVQNAWAARDNKTAKDLLEAFSTAPAPSSLVSAPRQ